MHMTNIPIRTDMHKNDTKVYILRGRKLDHNDITHYQKVIVVLTETERLMGEIHTAGA